MKENKNPRTQYKFLRRAGNLYFWEATRKVDSRVEQVYCNVPWFWGQSPDHTRITGKLLLGKTHV